MQSESCFHSDTLRPSFVRGLTIALLSFCSLTSLAAPSLAPTEEAPQFTIERQPTGAILHSMRSGEETLQITVCGPALIHIVAGPERPMAASSQQQTQPLQQPWMLNPLDPCGTASFEFAQAGNLTTITTAALQVKIDLVSGRLSYSDSAGNSLLRERGAREYVPDVVNGERVYRVTDRFSPGRDEGFYGLGQHQSGAYNYRGTGLVLEQENTDVAVPLLVSSNGYGILWNTAGRSFFDNRFPMELALTTSAADAIDYYFIYGPEMDQVIHQYREMTGHAPLFGAWAYGFIQSKDRYKSAQELLDIAAKYRSKNVPLDFIVQDWYWWQHQGDVEYNDDYLRTHPDVVGALKQLHAEHVHAMISIWPVLDPQAKNFKLLDDAGFMIAGTRVYDATNPKARDAYWKLLASQVFAQGWDGFWLDCTEPEVKKGDLYVSLYDNQLAIGNGARYTNVYPLLHTQGIYEHWRATTDQKRVFILSRSAFLGQQRNAAATWSGDVFGTFMSLARQIPAGLNFALSGIPYWTTDIGGYGPPFARDTHDLSYQELYTRWYEFGVFCPIFRTHGHRSNDQNELFSYDAQTPTLIAYDKLRYRLMPYIYSLAWRVTNEDYTIQRPLLMDWRTDLAARDIGDQFMFGPSILVNPVTTEGATSRFVYLPPTEGWYDFWTGEKLKGGQRIVAPAPLDRIPLYVRAGSIVPLGPEIDYVGQAPQAPIELRIYPGADATFSLYEDEGDSYAYEKGAYAIIPIAWNNATGTLTIGERKGSYPGMIAAHSFQVVVVDATHGVGDKVTDSGVIVSGTAVSGVKASGIGTTTIQYEGKPVSVVVRNLYP